MKRLLFCITVFISYKGNAQLHSGTPVVHSKAQPVPNSSTAEKSAPPQPFIIAPAPNPVPPVYPGAEVKVVEIPRQLINPPITPAGTQPKQKEPLSPIESTNVLQQNRPPISETSRINPVISVPAVNPERNIDNKNLNYNSIKVDPIHKISSPVSNPKNKVEAKSPTKKKVTGIKKPH